MDAPTQPTPSSAALERQLDGPVLVFYHAACSDGSAAAFAAWRELPLASRFVPIAAGASALDYGLEGYAAVAGGPPDAPAFAAVYFLDVFPPPEVVVAAVRTFGSALLLDHHASAFARLDELAELLDGASVDRDPEWAQGERPAHARAAELWLTGAPGEAGDATGGPFGALYVELDTERSAAVIASDFFGLSDAPTPELFRYIQDRDLWRWELPDSRQINEWLRQTLPLDVAANPGRWLEVLTYLEGQAGRDHAADVGAAVLARVDGLAALAAKDAEAVAFDLGKGPIVVPAVCLGARIQSEVGQLLLELHPRAPFSVTWTDQADGSRVYSLRARTETGPSGLSLVSFDVGVLAAAYGGGGHRAAAGFTLPAGARDAAAQAVVRAWTDEGVNPAHHRGVRAGLRDAWASLHKAVGDLVLRDSEAAFNLPPGAPAAPVHTHRPYS